MNIARITAQVYNYNGELVQVPMFQLLQFRSAIKLEILGMKNSRGSVYAHVCKLLSAPRSFGKQAMVDYLSETIANIEAQMGAMK